MLDVPWQHLMGSTALGTWLVWRPKKERNQGVSMHPTSQEQSRECPGVASDTTALQAWQPSEKTSPPQ